MGWNENRNKIQGLTGPLDDKKCNKTRCPGIDLCVVPTDLQAPNMISDGKNKVGCCDDNWSQVCPDEVLHET